ncbi:type II toxin-antitoxin system VapC family toxin [Patescibacteria group bacterium]|nr:type II toxin-antitoxin system VapC family toxin [Patescibacteria group bacterium]MBU1663293.1 type II toxin-antitoxin system VapC family toxin [Patescibacteria group bacterium]MBU1933945.1 type II toxin-antitoxin system VapC family toxin [Patescibacteria group bacterium]MBU2008056.1 type II toxin-antitoxin system VapC family toxin [Patescibacteria group bacterium]MBU2233832.1 type II toxin-antitoxin system VapC family toxin [Patescibacteria group bacterium]
MSKYFLESSAFTKRYRPEDGSIFIDQLFEGEHTLFYLNLAILEVRKVIFRLWKNPLEQDGQITEEEYNNLESRFAADIQKMIRVEFSEEMIKKSLEFLKTAGENSAWIKTSFDLAQLTAYLIAKEENNDLFFVCADECSHLIKAAKVFVNDSDIIIPTKNS